MSSRLREAVAALSRNRELCCLVVVVVLAGCAGVFGDDPELADGEAAAQQFTALDSYNATVTMAYTENGTTTTWTGRQVVAPGTGKFYERLRGPNGTQITVSDGADTWLYSPANDRAQRIDPDGLADSISSEISELVARAKAEDGESGESIQLLPFVPQFSQASASAPAGARRVTHEGTATVAGREAHVIAIEDTDGTYSVRHYLDTEHYVPLKTEAAFGSGTDRVEYSLTTEAITFEPQLPSGLFEFTPPADVSVDEYPFEEEELSDRAALEEAATIAVPDPDVPDGFTLERAERFVPGAETVELTYTSERGELTVAKTNVTLGAATPDDQITVGGRTMNYTSAADHNSVTWTCNGNYHSVRGDLDRDLLVDVAASIDC